MRVVFRVDASVRIGLGHQARCLALAASLRERGGEVLFVTRDLGLDDLARIQSQGFAHRQLPPPHGSNPPVAGGDAPPHAAWAEVPWELDAEQTASAVAVYRPSWIVVDHYAFDAAWHRRVAAATGARLAAIDDLANRPMAVRLIVDQNLGADRAKYAAAGIGAARLIGGPRYALLAPGYLNAAKWALRHPARSIGIFMGGTDPLRLSEMALRACREVAGFTGAVEVATTQSNPACRELVAACARYEPAQLLIDAPDLAAFFARHDLQIGAGGGAAWERCCIGAPTIALAFADNQRPVVAGLAGLGAVEAASPDAAGIGSAVRRLLDAPQARQRLADSARSLVDGRGAERVALALLADSLVLVPATAADSDLAYRWRNDERTRRYFRDPSPMPRDTHDRWWARALDGADRTLLVARCGGTAVGFVRLDDSGDGSAEVSFYLDPELTGLGLGSAALRRAQRWIEARADVSRLVAHVLPENAASALAFAAAGFARVSEADWRWERGR